MCRSPQHRERSEPSRRGEHNAPLLTLRWTADDDLAAVAS
jgi:hypothetical protein